jgi:excisionase family DNA binding protein
MTTFSSDHYLTVEQVAEYLKFSEGTIYNKISAGEIPFHKFGAKIIRFKKDEIDAWLAQQEEKTTGRKPAESLEKPGIDPDIIDILKNNPIEAPAFLRQRFPK